MQLEVLLKKETAASQEWFCSPCTRLLAGMPATAAGFHHLYYLCQPTDISLKTKATNQYNSV